MSKLRRIGWIALKRPEKPVEAPEKPPEVRPRGKCPRGTPGCVYADCSPQLGKSCYGGDAPRHFDMGV